jgi:hypothetical protein
MYLRLKCECENIKLLEENHLALGIGRHFLAITPKIKEKN